MKKLILNILLASLFVAGYSQSKVVEESGKKPSWVNAMRDGYVIGSGTASDVESAKEEAFLKVKSQINAAVAENINTTTQLYNEEVTADNLSSLYEKFSSMTTTQTGKRDFLHGVSPSKVEDYYWEKLRDKKSKEEKVIYHILYPFSNFELMKLVDEFKEKDAELTAEMQKSLNILDDYTSVEQIMQAIAQLKKFTEIFIDERKAKCEVGIEKGETLLSSIYIVDKGSTLGEALYSLQIGDRVVTTAQRPKLKTNCAYITQKSFGKEVCTITYDYNECYDEPGNNIQLSYRIANRTIDKEFMFDIGASQLKVAVNGLIRIENGKVTVPIISKTETSFVVTKVMLDLEDGNSITFEPNQNCSGVGQKEIKGQTNYQAEESNSIQNVNGYIYLTNVVTNEKKSVRLYKQAIKIN